MIRKQARGVTALTSALVLALGVAACGGAGAGEESSGTSEPARSSYDTMSTEQLAAAAAKEGSVTWYTTFASDDVAPVVAAFNEHYPDVKVDVLRMSADEIPSRVMTEQRARTFNGDVVSGDSPQLAQLIAAKALQPYSPPRCAGASRRKENPSNAARFRYNPNAAASAYSR